MTTHKRLVSSYITVYFILSVIVLVTGGAGFIGYHTAQQLVQKRAKLVVVLDNFNDYYDVTLKKSRAEKLRASGETSVMAVCVLYSNRCCCT